jgi:CHASE3 domain sensor protein
MPIKKLLLNRNVIHGGFYAAAGLVALLIYLTYDQDRQYTANTRRLIRTHQVLTESERLYSLLKDCQRSFRGYLLTQDEALLAPALLAPYRQAKRTMPGSLERVRTLAGADSPQQRQRLENMRVLIGESLAHWDNTLRLNDREGPRAAIEIVKAGYGRNLVDRAYGIIAGFQQHERRQLAGQQARYERSQWTAALVQRAGGTVGLLLLGFSCVLLRGWLKHKEQWAYQLEARVRERTRELKASQAVLSGGIQ